MRVAGRANSKRGVYFRTVKTIAEKTGSVGVLLYGNPAGPLSFNGNVNQTLFGRKLLAYSWEQSIKDPENHVVSGHTL